jgi:hypothetical protein
MSRGSVRRLRSPRHSARRKPTSLDVHASRHVPLPRRIQHSTAPHHVLLRKPEVRDAVRGQLAGQDVERVHRPLSEADEDVRVARCWGMDAGRVTSERRHADASRFLRDRRQRGQVVDHEGVFDVDDGQIRRVGFEGKQLDAKAELGLPAERHGRSTEQRNAAGLGAYGEQALDGIIGLAGYFAVQGQSAKSVVVRGREVVGEVELRLLRLLEGTAGMLEHGPARGGICRQLAVSVEEMGSWS